MKELKDYERKGCNPKTIRELKEIVNRVPEKYLDKEINYFHEEDGGGSKCVGVWLDLFFDYKTLETCFSFSTSGDEESHKYHDGGTPWYYSEYYED